MRLKHPTRKSPQLLSRAGQEDAETTKKGKKKEDMHKSAVLGSPTPAGSEETRRLAHSRLFFPERMYGRSAHSISACSEERKAGRLERNWRGEGHGCVGCGRLHAAAREAEARRHPRLLLIHGPQLDLVQPELEPRPHLGRNGPRFRPTRARRAAISRAAGRKKGRSPRSRLLQLHAARPPGLLVHVVAERDVVRLVGERHDALAARARGAGRPGTSSATGRLGSRRECHPPGRNASSKAAPAAVPPRKGGALARLSSFGTGNRYLSTLEVRCPSFDENPSRMMCGYASDMFPSTCIGAAGSRRPSRRRVSRGRTRSRRRAARGAGRGAGARLVLDVVPHDTVHQPKVGCRPCGFTAHGRTPSLGKFPRRIAGRRASRGAVDGRRVAAAGPSKGSLTPRREPRGSGGEEFGRTERQVADDQPVRLPPVLVDDDDVREPAGPAALHEVANHLWRQGLCSSPGSDAKRRASRASVPPERGRRGRVGSGAAWLQRGGPRGRPRSQPSAGERACPPLLMRCAFGKMSFSSFANAVRRLLGSLLVVTSTFGSSSPVAAGAERAAGL